jgi:hypothetical protein
MSNSIKKLYSWLREQCDYVATMAREFDPDPCNDLEAAEIVEEARRRCCRFGFDDLGKQVHVISARSALPILGKMLTWAREQKSKGDWLTPPQVARIMGIKADKVLYWIHTGQLHAHNVAKDEGGRPQFVVPPADLELFKTRRSTQPPVRVKRARPEPCGKYHF